MSDLAKAERSEIYWTGDRFHCNNDKLEVAHQIALESQLNAKHICEQMQILSFNLDTICLDLYPRKPFPKGLSFYPKGLAYEREGFTIEEQGTGFNICFNLIGYEIAARDLGLELRIYSGSFQGCLHPLLYKFLTEFFVRRGRNDVYNKCLYFANSEHLKCTVNPSTLCKECVEAPQWFKDSAFEWIELGSWQHLIKYREMEPITYRRSESTALIRD